MLSITTIKRQNVGKVVNYYADSADDYYAKDGSAMQWQGKGAEAMGLNGQVDQTRFAELLDGKIDKDTTLRRTTPSEARKERLGYDLTFSAPKGVSLQALVHGDQRIVMAHDKAVAAAIREAEMLAAARHTTKGKTSTEQTKKLVVATFRHETSREVDPDLHTHAFVLNMTQRENGQWRALVNDGIVHSLTHLGNVYKAELAKELELQGFTLKYDRKGTFDLAHFTEYQINEFSGRRNQIDAKLTEWGLDRETATSEQKNRAAMQTRERKTEIDRDVVRDAWQARAKDLGIDFHSREWKGAGKYGPDHELRNSAPQIERPLEFHADKTVDFAIKSLTERKAIVTGDELMAAALKHGYGRLSAVDIRLAIDRAKNSGHLIRENTLYRSMNPAKQDKERPDSPSMTRKQWVDELEKMGRTRAQALTVVDHGIAKGRLQPEGIRYTTHIAQRRELDILALERSGRGKIERRVTQEKIDVFLSNHAQKGKLAGLNPEQSRAVARIADTENRFMAVPGFAGVGKSFMTKSAKELLEENGFRVTALAPYGSQKKALEAEGIEARTLQSFLKAKDKKIDGKTVVFIDEAGVIPARQMLETMKVIEAAGARAVFLGDTAQTKAIEAGKPFEQMLKAGLQSSEIRTIQRQKNPELLKAVELAAVGQATESLAHVTRIQTIKDAADRYSQIVQSYAALTPAERSQTLVITGTNSSRKQINEGIQNALGLAGTGREYILLDRLDTTQAERRHSKYYEKGAIIIPERDYKNGLQRGEQYKVLDTGPGNRLTVETRNGRIITFCPAQTTQISVYKPERTEIAVGDQIKITRNDKDRDLANGDRLIVKEVRDNVIFAEGQGRNIKLDASQAMYAALAYASTVHSAQGLTSDKVLINLETKSLTTAKDVYYVAVSRARYEAEIFTDDGSKLGKAISRESDKTAALEIDQLRHLGRNKSTDMRSNDGPSERSGQVSQKPLREKGERDMTIG